MCLLSHPLSVLWLDFRRLPADEKFTERPVRKSTRCLSCFHCRGFARRRARTCIVTRSRAGMEAFGKKMSELTGDFDSAQWAGWLVPGADPVDGSGHGEGGELGIARCDGFIGDSFFDVATDGGVDAPLE